MYAKDIMTENPVTASEQMTVSEALGLLYELDVRHLPVVRGKELVGIISDRDLRAFSEATEEKAVEAYESSQGASVSDVMNGDPIKVDPETSAREMVDLMLLHRVGALPVADPDTNDLVGIVSYIDLLKILQETLEPAG